MAAGAALALATIENADVATAEDARTVIATVALTAAADVGFTVAEGVKVQVAPAGNPVQLKFTGKLNDPAPLTWKVIGDEVVPRGTVMLADDGLPCAKSITCSARAAV